MKATTIAAAAVMVAGSAVADYAPVNGLKLYYEVHGPAESAQTPVVLIHGGGSTIETSFAEMIPLLATDRKVIAFDQQGHGRTADIVDRPFTFEQSADDTVALLDHLGIDRADVIGFSNGGSIALQVAIRHPERVRKVVSISAMTKRDGMMEGFWAGMSQATLETMPAELRQAYLDVAPEPEHLQLFFDKSVTRMVTFTDWPDAMVRSITAPTLVVAGDRDVVRPEHAVEMYRTLPRGQLAVIPGADHSLTVTRADVLASLINTFLSETQEH